MLIKNLNTEITRYLLTNQNYMTTIFTLSSGFNLIIKRLRFCVYLLTFLVLFISQANYSQSNDDCLMCHSDNELTMEKKGKEISLFVKEDVIKNSVHAKLSCVSCHKGFDAENLPHAENIKEINCVSCHQKTLVKHSFHPQILKSEGTGKTQDTSCKSCHGIHDVRSNKESTAKWNRDNLVESCGSCHSNVEMKFNGSKHFTALQNKVKGAPDCITCHQNPVSHKFYENDVLKTKLVQEKLCLSCHLENAETKQRVTSTAGFISQYEKSVHGNALLSGNPNSATCVDCHDSHAVISEDITHSSVFRLNIPKTCSKCHTEIAKEYNESVHGVFAAKGHLESPVCTNCHGEHNISNPNDPKSQLSFVNLSKETCTPCHSSLKLSNRFGIQSDRYNTFADSYHGLALRGGSTIVANCASCHGVHNIKPSTDSTSTVHKDNLIKTCGSCHPGANTQFVSGKIHLDVNQAEDPLLYWISTIYIMMIISVVGGMFLHNALDFFRKGRIKKLKQRGFIREEHHGTGLYLRMSLNERIQHITMALSFIILVITGFMLRYPEAWWVGHIKDLSNDAFEYRSLIHRIAAVVMVAVSLFHIYYVSFTQRGRQLVKDFLPNFKDLTDAIGIAKFNLGLSNVKPKLDRFSYVEKAEYWALIWGTIVMTVTGLVMWIYDEYVGSFSKFEWDIARTIHYYEAWLAFLSIIVWHFYFVIFNPDIYPMNVAWIKGTISEEEMNHEHPLELERIKAAKRKETSPSDSENVEE